MRAAAPSRGTTRTRAAPRGRAAPTLGDARSTRRTACSCARHYRRRLDEPVARERGDGFVVVRLFAGEDQAQCSRATLPERALEARLLSERLVPATARRATFRERADPAAWYAGEADGRAEIHQRLRAARAESMPGPLLHAAHV